MRSCHDPPSPPKISTQIDAQVFVMLSCCDGGYGWTVQNHKDYNNNHHIITENLGGEKESSRVAQIGFAIMEMLVRTRIRNMICSSNP